MTGNSFIDRIIYAINIMGIFIALITLFYKEFIYERPEIENEQEFTLLKTLLRKKVSTGTLKLKKVTLNLFSRRQRLRFLDVQMHLFPFKDRQLKILENKNTTYMIYDVVIKVVGEMRPESINTLAGKIILENRIKKEINRRLRRNIVKKIFFTTFVVQ